MSPTAAQIIAALPYSSPFLFVDELSSLTDSHIIGHYTYRPNEFFYAGHFVGNPITPGVILLETIAQIGGVAMGFYLLGNQMQQYKPLFSRVESADFYGIVLPNTRVTVRSTKQYFRRNALKVQAEMTTDDGTLVCEASISCQFVAR